MSPGLEVLVCRHTALGNSFLIHVVLNWKLLSEALILFFFFGMIKHTEGENKTYSMDFFYYFFCLVCFDVRSHGQDKHFITTNKTKSYIRGVWRHKKYKRHLPSEAFPSRKQSYSQHESALRWRGLAVQKLSPHCKLKQRAEQEIEALFIIKFFFFSSYIKVGTCTGCQHKLQFERCCRNT